PRGSFSTKLRRLWSLAIQRDCSQMVSPGGGATPPTITSPTSPSAWQEMMWMEREVLTRARWPRPPPSHPPPQGGRCRSLPVAQAAPTHRTTPSPLWGGLGRGAAPRTEPSLDHRDRFAQHVPFRRDAEAGRVAGGHEAVLALRRTIGDRHRDVGVEVGRREAEALRR